MFKLKTLRSLLAILALSLAASQAIAAAARPGKEAPLSGITFSQVPAGYRNVNHCGLVRLAPMASAPRHSLRSATLRQAPLPGRSSASLGSRGQDLRQRLAGSQRGWDPSQARFSSRPLRAQQLCHSTGCTRQWSIRPPPTQSL